MFDVYVDGATGPSREAVHELASALAVRYRLPVAELEARLTRGRFRVKAGVDRATAEAYLRDLAAIGARVRIEPAGEPPARPSQPELRSSPPSQLEPRPAQPSLPPQPEPRAMRSSLPPQPEPRLAQSSLPPQAEPRPARSPLPPQSEPRPARSSLPPLPGSQLPPVAPAAGSSGSSGGGGVVATTGPMATLGALDRSGVLSLATLDDEPAQLPSTDGVLPASMGPAAPRPARPARPRNEPIDPFAPPEPAAEELLLQLIDEDVGHRAQRQASTPPALAGEPLRSTAPSQSLAGVPPGSAPVPSATLAGVAQSLPPALPVGPPPQSSGAPVSALARALRTLGSELVARIPVLGSARVQLVAGVALAIALGFVPAHLVAGMRERSAFGAIDARVVAVQSTADTPDSYAALDAFRAEQLDAKYSARRSIAVTSLLVWAAVGAALAFGWFSLFRAASAAPGGTRDPRGG